MYMGSAHTKYSDPHTHYRPVQLSAHMHSYQMYA